MIEEEAQEMLTNSERCHYYIYWVHPDVPNATITRKKITVSCPFCKVPIPQEEHSLDVLWNHLNQSHHEMDYTAMQDPMDGSIHIAAKRKMKPFVESFAPLLESRTSLSEAIAANPWPKRTTYRRVDNFKEISIAEWILDIYAADQIDTTWRDDLAEENLHEFDDVTESEKIFMKLWNIFMKEMKQKAYVGPSDISKTCQVFVKQHFETIRDDYLYRDLLKFLCNLRLQNLITRADIIECTRLYDELGDLVTEEPMVTTSSKQD